MNVQSKERATFNVFLDQALACTRSIEKIYIERSLAPDLFPRSVADFLTVVREAEPEIEFDVRIISLPPEKVALSEIVLFRSTPKRSATVALPKVNSSLTRYATCRGVFMILLRYQNPDLLIDDGQAMLRSHVDETIYRSWEKGLSEAAREIIPSNLLEVISDIAAAEFLFPYRERLKVKARDPDSASITTTAQRFGIPVDIARYYMMESTMSVFSGFPILLPPT